MDADVGNALLAENQELKQDLIDLKIKNSKQALEIKELKSVESSSPVTIRGN